MSDMGAGVAGSIANQIFSLDTDHNDSLEGAELNGPMGNFFEKR